MTIRLKTERYATGKYDVITLGDYPRRVGHIVGGRDTWLAEVPYKDLGYFKTLKAARQAIERHTD